MTSKREIIRSAAERLHADEAARRQARRLRRRATRARALRGNNDPMLYDVQFNTAHLSVAEVAGAITQIVRARST